MAQGEKPMRVPVALLLLLSLAACRSYDPFVSVLPPLTQDPGTPPPPPAAAPAAQATATRQPFGERFGFRLGGFLASSFDTTASLDLAGTNFGTELDFEDVFGLERETEAFRVDTYLRFGRAHRLDVGYFKLERDATRAVNREIVWGDLTIPIGFDVKSFLDTDILQARYTWYPVRGRNYELGIGGGIYGMDLSVGLAVNTLNAATTWSTPLPLPVISVQGAWEFVPRLQLVGSAQLFYLELESAGPIEELQGGILDLNLGLEYDLFDHVGLGASVNYFQLEVEAEKSGLALDLEYEYVGLFAYMVVKI